MCVRMEGFIHSGGLRLLVLCINLLLLSDLGNGFDLKVGKMEISLSF